MKYTILIFLLLSPLTWAQLGEQGPGAFLDLPELESSPEKTEPGDLSAKPPPPAAEPPQPALTELPPGIEELPELKPLPESGSQVGDAAAKPPVKKKKPAKRKAKKTPFKPTIPAEQDSPDFGAEANFNTIYQKYYSKPISEEDWLEIIKDRKGKVYPVQQGDTLWDISKMFFGDANYWPKLWSINNKITNPHWLNEGGKIMYYPGTATDAPIVTLLAEGPGADQQTEQQSAKAEEGSIVDIPLPKARAPVMQTLPESLPSWQFLMEVKTSAPQFNINAFKFPSATVDLPYYIIDGEINNAIGKITETEVGSATAAEFQRLFVDGDLMQEGDIYTVVKELGPAIASNKKKLGNIVQVQGEIKILKRVDGYYLAEVVRNLYPIDVGAKVIAGRIPTLSLDVTQGPSRADAQIIGGEFDVERGMLADQSVVFIDRGTVDGFAPEQVYAIHSMHQARNPKSKIKSNTRRIGALKIVHTSQRVSTGLIIFAEQEVNIGDLVGLEAGAGGNGNGGSVLPAPQEDSADFFTDETLEGEADQSTEPSSQQPQGAEDQLWEEEEEDANSFGVPPSNSKGPYPLEEEYDKMLYQKNSPPAEGSSAPASDFDEEFNF